MPKAGDNTKFDRHLLSTTSTIRQDMNLGFAGLCLSIKDCSLVVVEGPHEGHELRLDREVVYMGRAEWCDIVLDQDPWVSNCHCSLHPTEDGIRLRDCDSSNGLFLGGQRIFEALLKPTTRFRLGRSIIELRANQGTTDIPIPPGDTLGLMVGVSDAMRRIFSLSQRLAPRNISVLIGGETGTGKSALAELFHRQSKRSNGSFVVVNCGAFPAGTIESELFGHEKGAFTGATHRHQGCFERANGGTLFLDEIGELPLELQPKLLEVLERKKVRRLGGSQEIDLDFRVLTATNRELPQLIAAGQFREDLYYRLAVVEIEMPPLRERRQDIPLLVETLTKRLLRKIEDQGNVQFSASAMAHLQTCFWRGNVRELANCLERTLSLREHDLIDLDELVLPPEDIRAGNAAANKATDLNDLLRIQLQQGSLDLKNFLQEVEVALLREALELNDGRASRAAKHLGISRGWIYKRMDKYGMSPSSVTKT